MLDTERSGESTASPGTRLSLGKLMPYRLKLESPNHKNGARVRTYAQITGWGSFAPSSVLTNHDLTKIVDTNDEWIRERTGIRVRHICGPKECTSTMAIRAARNALAVAGLSPTKLDAIVVATSTEDSVAPNVGSIVQNAIGAMNAGAFDINAGCSGFVYGLVVANGLITSGSHRNVLLIGADALSRVTDYTDRGTCILFGDAAGAVVLQATDAPTGVVSSTLGSDGFGGDLLYVTAGGSRVPASHETVDKRQHYLVMNGREVFKFAVTKIVKSVHQVLADAGLQLEDVDLFVLHQANLRIIQAAAKALKVPEEKFFVNIERYGNTSSATIPLAISEAVEAGRIKEGDRLVLAAFGAGLTWAAAVVQWGAPPVAPKHPAWHQFVQRGQLQMRRTARLTARRLDPRRWLD